MTALNKSAQTKEVYSFLWKRGNHCLPLDRWHFNDMQDMVPENIVRGKMGIEVGSGCGYDTNIMARNNPQVKIISIDFSEGVHESKEINASLMNVTLIQGSVLEMPFISGVFDFVYSYGVLHHTPNPVQGIKEIHRVLKLGAPVFVYLYEDHSENILKYTAIKITTLFRIITTKINKKALYFLCFIASPVVFLIFSLPARFLRAFKHTKELEDKFPFNFAKSPFSLKGDLYDRFSAPIEFRYSKKDAYNLLEKNGYVNITVNHLKRKSGWLVWGYKIAC